MVGRVVALRLGRLPQNLMPESAAAVVERSPTWNHNTRAVSPPQNPAPASPAAIVTTSNPGTDDDGRDVIRAHDLTKLARCSRPRALGTEDTASPAEVVAFPAFLFLVSADQMGKSRRQL